MDGRTSRTLKRCSVSQEERPGSRWRVVSLRPRAANRCGLTGTATAALAKTSSAQRHASAQLVAHVAPPTEEALFQRPARPRPPRRSIWCAALILLLTSAASAAAQTPEDQGLAIAREADRRARGYSDYTARLTMVLRSRDGREREREMRVSGLAAANGAGERTVIIFDSPRDLRGTALLTHSHSQESDDQWLYLPSFKRVKRIAAAAQSGSFMGSEFAYEDIGSQQLEKFTYRYVRDDNLGGVEAFVVERYPVDSRSGYSRQVVWLDKQEYRPLRIAYYGRGGELVKTLSFRHYRLYAGEHWRPDEMIMANHQTGRTTTLRWAEYKFDTGRSERDFSPNRLARLGG